MKATTQRTFTLETLQGLLDFEIKNINSNRGSLATLLAEFNFYRLGFDPKCNGVSYFRQIGWDNEKSYYDTQNPIIAANDQLAYIHVLNLEISKLTN
jgi:hypothetical protein